LENVGIVGGVDVYISVVVLGVGVGKGWA